MALIKEPSPHNIWNSFEFDCISRNFNYESYVELAQHANVKHALLSEHNYNVLGDIFFDEMAASYDNQPVCSVTDNTQVS